MDYKKLLIALLQNINNEDYLMKIYYFATAFVKGGGADHGKQER